MKRRTTMRRLCDGKMWKAVDAMIKGMRKHSKRKKFAIEMRSFGDYDSSKEFCTGCAATCTIQQLSGVSFTDEKITYYDTRSKFVNVTHNDLELFENAIDNFRCGCGSWPDINISPLMNYFKIKTNVRPDIIEKFEKLPKLDNSSWRSGLPFYREFCNYLKKLDI